MIDINRIGTSFLVISKESVLKNNIAHFENFVDSICFEQLKRGQVNHATAVLSIDGYNDDSRSIWCIPEVQEWYKSLHSARPYAPYFLSPASIQIYFTCLEPFFNDLLPKEYSTSKQPLLSCFVRYTLDKFIDLLRVVMFNQSNDLKDHVFNESSERVFSALRNLNEGKSEPL